MIEFDKEIVTARKCPYCGLKPDYVDSKVVYGKSYGMIYYCKDCDAYVGVHHGTSKRSLGRLADRDLRHAKKRAHFYFDQLWKTATEQGRGKGKSRKLAYAWLRDKIGTPKKFTHIGMFDIDLCNKVVEYSMPYCRKKTYPGN